MIYTKSTIEKKPKSKNRDMHSWLEGRDLRQSLSLNPVDLLQLQNQGVFTKKEKQQVRESTTSPVQPFQEIFQGSLTMKPRKQDAVERRERDAPDSNRLQTSSKRRQSDNPITKQHSEKQLTVNRPFGERGSLPKLVKKETSQVSHNSISSANSSMLESRRQEEESKLKQLSLFKQNMTFSLKVRNFRDKVLTMVTELCKEDGKKDFDAMAKLVSEYEQLEDKGLIGWALGRLQTISPTIGLADKKLSGVLEAI